MPAPKPLPEPRQLEAQYTSQVVGSVKDLQEFVGPRVRDLGERRLDALSDDFAELLDSLRRQWATIWSDSRITQMARRMYARLSDWHVRVFTSEYEGIIPIPATVSTAEDELLASFVRQNVRLIKSMHSDTFSQVENQVLEAVKNGTRSKELAKRLRERFDVSKSRAALIARDQVGKAVGDMTVERLTAAGVQKAKWVTSRDERVRPSHQRADGKVFDLAEGLLVDGVRTWPGQPVRCRCASVAVLSE